MGIRRSYSLSILRVSSNWGHGLRVGVCRSQEGEGGRAGGLLVRLLRIALGVSPTAH